MSGFLGEISCKIDTKGRFVMPTKFLRQLPPEANNKMVVNRGFEQCLTLYTWPEWTKVTDELQSLNTYNPLHLRFIRQFFRGATEMQFDASNRLLIPKSLTQYADLKKEIILLGYFNRIEIWSAKVYEEVMAIDPEEFAELANKVMGNPTANEDLIISGND
jgi:MraZ protein